MVSSKLIFEPEFNFRQQFRSSRDSRLIREERHHCWFTQPSCYLLARRDQGLQWHAMSGTNREEVPPITTLRQGDSCGSDVGMLTAYAVYIALVQT